MLIPRVASPFPSLHSLQLRAPSFFYPFHSPFLPHSSLMLTFPIAASHAHLLDPFPSLTHLPFPFSLDVPPFPTSLMPAHSSHHSILPPSSSHHLISLSKLTPSQCHSSHVVSSPFPSQHPSPITFLITLTCPSSTGAHYYRCAGGQLAEARFTCRQEDKTEAVPRGGCYLAHLCDRT